MLKEFSFSNFASYLDTANFTMETSKYVKDFKGLNTFETKNVELVKSAFIFGANASGKTNITKAISFMKSLVLFSFENESILKNTNKFMFSSDSNKTPSRFEVVFIVPENDDEITYRYGFEINHDKISKEWLYRKVKKEVCIFERDENLPEKIRICRNEFKKAELVREYTRDNALFVSTAYKFNVTFVNVIRDWFKRIEVINFHTTPGETASLLKNDESKYKPLILEYLRQADFGISDFSIEIKDVDLSSKEKFLDILQNSGITITVSESGDDVVFPSKMIDLKTKHKVYNQEKELSGEKIISFTKYQSEGTIKFFELIGPFINALLDKKIIFVDEIDSRLHCAIVKFLVSLFNSIDINADNAQLIATTHDVLLLEENIRRDQIWFSQKNQYGESELYCLSDFTGVRKKDLLLKKYLMGQFGAIPFIGRK